MKRILKVFSVSLLSLMVSLCLMVPIKAEEQLIITENNIQELDQFITVEKNQFVLNIPEHVVISNELKTELIKKNTEINNIIKQENFVINPKTKIAEPLIQTRAYGENSISLSWNSIIIFMDAGLVQTILKAAAAGGIAGAVVAFPVLVAWIAANPISGVAVTAVVASIVDPVIDIGTDDGVEIHYNFFLFSVTVARLQ